MQQREDWTLLVAGILVVLTASLLITLEPRVSSLLQRNQPTPMASPFLSDPFLQLPTPNTVRVVWFTEFEGRDHTVLYGQPDAPADESALGRVVFAETTLLSRTREDDQSDLDHPDYADLGETVRRPIWRHEAEVIQLNPGERVPYQVLSTTDEGETRRSRIFTLAAAPPPGQSLKILLTSDHQQKPMTAANLQKAVETVGRVDAVFMAGDLVNIPDRASEWFDNASGNAFFPCLQGLAQFDLEQNGQITRYRGGEIIQHAPLFPALGNHEVMGRYSSTRPLGEQFNDPIPRAVAAKFHDDNQDLFNPAGDLGLRRQWIDNNSFNSETYEEIFSLPSSGPTAEQPDPTERYYAVTFGDIRLVSLYVTQIWRRPALSPTVQGRYQERESDLGTPQNWGYGQHIFEPINQGSPQYQWLEQELASEAFQNAKYRIVMLHHPPHSLGDNIVPPFTDPVPVLDRWPDGSLKAVRYEYPRADDSIARDLVPLLEQAGVHLVFYGHSHLWNRFVNGNTHYLETSNVGNTYGAYWKDQTRSVPPAEGTEYLNGFQTDNYAATGDPNGLEPIIPTVAPLMDDQGNPQPYLASNDITAFSIFDTGTGTVSSYYFDTGQPNSQVIKFDEFNLGGSFVSQSPTSHQLTAKGQR